MGEPVASWLLEVPGLRVADYRCRAKPGDRVFEERHDAVCISYVQSGTFEYRIAQGPVALPAGAFMLGNPGQAYECSHERGPADRCLSLLFDPALFESVAALAGGRGRPTQFRLAMLPPLAAASAWVHRLLAALRGAASGAAPDEIALELAARVMAAHEDSAGAKPRRCVPSNRHARLASEALAFLDDRSSGPIGLGDVARAVGLSPFHFLRVFRACFGITPHQYLLRRRLDRAAARLLDGDESVTEIAYAVGFGDLANFIRSFRAAVGCSPRAFRNGSTRGKTRRRPPRVALTPRSSSVRAAPG